MFCEKQVVFNRPYSRNRSTKCHQCGIIWNGYSSKFPWQASHAINGFSTNIKSFKVLWQQVIWSTALLSRMELCDWLHLAATMTALLFSAKRSVLCLSQVHRGALCTMFGKLSCSNLCLTMDERGSTQPFTSLGRTNAGQQVQRQKWKLLCRESKLIRPSPCKVMPALLTEHWIHPSVAWKILEMTCHLKALIIWFMPTYSQHMQ